MLDHKERFLHQYQESTQKVFRHRLERIADTERQVKKDLAQFNAEEVESALYDLKPLTINSALSNANFVSVYLNWAIDEGYRETTDHPLQGINMRAYANQFVSTDKQTLFSEEEINSIIGDVTNPMDAAMIRLLFEGAYGSRLRELRSIHESDIDRAAGTIALCTGRTLPVTDMCMSLVEKALEQTVYYDRHASHKEKPLCDTRDLFRSVESNRTKHPQLAYFAAIRRLSTIQEEQGLEYFNPTTIRKSGMVWMASQWYEESGTIGKQAFEAICQQYHTPRMTVGKYEYANTYELRKIITTEALRDLYGIAITFPRRLI